MSKQIIIVWLLLVCSFSFCFQLNVGEGTVVNQHLPCDPYYNHSGSQLIYDSDYFPYNGIITQISFHYNFTSANPESFINDITIMIGESSLDSYENEDDFVDLNLLELCFEGNLTEDNFQAINGEGEGWMVIQLTQPYSYSGSGNLILFFLENNSENALNSDNFLVFSTPQNSSMCFIDFENPLDVDDLVTPTFIRNYLPNTNFEFMIDENYPLVIAPLNNASDITTTTSLQISVLDLSNASINITTNNYEFPLIITDNFSHINSNTFEIFPELPFSPNTHYDWQVAYNSGEAEFYSEEVCFETADEECEFSITSLETDSYSVNIEWSSLYNNQYSYYIYRDEELISVQCDNSYIDTQVLLGETYDYQIKFFYIDDNFLQTNTCSIKITDSDNVLLDDEFENYSSFSTVVGEWQNIDNDGASTYILNGFTYPNAGAATGFVVFEPDAITPPLNLNISGDKCLVSFSSTIPPTSDLLISSPFQASQVEVDLYLKSLDTSWGMERVRYGVVYNNDQDNLISCLDGDYCEIGAEMTHLNFIHDTNNSDDLITNFWLESCGVQTLMLIIDRIVVSSMVTSNDGSTMESVCAPIIFPNPIRNGNFDLATQRGNTDIRIYNLKGQLVYQTKSVRKNARIFLPDNLASGVYLVKIKSKTGVFVRKVSVIKN